MVFDAAVLGFVGALGHRTHQEFRIQTGQEIDQFDNRPILDDRRRGRNGQGIETNEHKADICEIACRHRLVWMRVLAATVHVSGFRPVR